MFSLERVSGLAVPGRDTDVYPDDRKRRRIAACSLAPARYRRGVKAVAASQQPSNLLSTTLGRRCWPSTRVHPLRCRGSRRRPPACTTASTALSWARAMVLSVSSRRELQGAARRDHVLGSNFPHTGDRASNCPAPARLAFSILCVQDGRTRLPVHVETRPSGRPPTPHAAHMQQSPACTFKCKLEDEVLGPPGTTLTR